MSDVNWPDTLPVQTMVWRINKLGVQFQSPFTGTPETVTFPGWFWTVSITLKPRRSKGADAAEAEGFFNGVAGVETGILLYHWLRPVPRGTMRGSPTIAAAVARGLQSVTINTTGNLKRGDLFKVAGVVYQCFADCSPAAGVLTVPLTARVRAPLAGGAPVEWDRPTIRCIVPSMSNAVSYRPGIMEALPIDLVEG